MPDFSLAETGIVPAVTHATTFAEPWVRFSVVMYQVSVMAWDGRSRLLQQTSAGSEGAL